MQKISEVIFALGNLFVRTYSSVKWSGESPKHSTGVRTTKPLMHSLLIPLLWKAFYEEQALVYQPNHVKMLRGFICTHKQFRGNFVCIHLELTVSFWRPSFRRTESKLWKFTIVSRLVSYHKCEIFMESGSTVWRFYSFSVLSGSGRFVRLFRTWHLALG